MGLHIINNGAMMKFWHNPTDNGKPPIMRRLFPKKDNGNKQSVQTEVKADARMAQPAEVFIPDLAWNVYSKEGAASLIQDKYAKDRVNYSFVSNTMIIAAIEEGHAKIIGEVAEAAIANDGRIEIGRLTPEQQKAVEEQMRIERYMKMLADVEDKARFGNDAFKIIDEICKDYAVEMPFSTTNGERKAIEAKNKEIRGKIETLVPIMLAQLKMAEIALFYMSDWNMEAEEIRAIMKSISNPLPYSGLEEYGKLITKVDTALEAVGYMQGEGEVEAVQEKAPEQPEPKNKQSGLTPEQASMKVDEILGQIRQEQDIKDAFAVIGNFSASEYRNGGGSNSIPPVYVSKNMNLLNVIDFYGSDQEIAGRVKGYIAKRWRLEPSPEEKSAYRSWIEKNGQEVSKLRKRLGSVEAPARMGIADIGTMLKISDDEAARLLKIVKRGEVEGVLGQMTPGKDIDETVEKIYRTISFANISNPLPYENDPQYYPDAKADRGRGEIMKIVLEIMGEQRG